MSTMRVASPPLGRLGLAVGPGACGTTARSVAAQADGARGVAAGPVACGLAVDARAAGEGRVASPCGLSALYSFRNMFFEQQNRSCDKLAKIKLK